MPNKCVRCGTVYKDGSIEILKGCNVCNGRLFLYIKEEQLNKAEELTSSLTSKDKTQIEKDVLEIIGIENEEEPVVLDFESIKINKPGKYELDLVEIFRKKPLIYRTGEGKYLIDLDSAFKGKVEDEFDKKKAKIKNKNIIE